jgi:hypothetical protein
MCLSYFKDLKFDNLKFLLQNSKNAEEGAFQALEKMYGLLQIYNPEYMTFCENSKDSPSNSMFAITNSLKFVGLNERLSDQNFTMKNSVLMKK